MLVDSHIFLWFASGDVKRMRGSAVAMMTRRDVRLRPSVVTLWELSIKHALGRLALPLYEALGARMVK